MHNLFKEIIDSKAFKESVKAIKKAGKVLEKLSPDLSLSNIEVTRLGVDYLTLAGLKHCMAELLYAAFVKEAGYTLNDSIEYVGFDGDCDTIYVSDPNNTSERYMHKVKLVANKYDYEIEYYCEPDIEESI